MKNDLALRSPDLPVLQKCQCSKSNDRSLLYLTKNPVTLTSSLPLDSAYSRVTRFIKPCNMLSILCVESFWVSILKKKHNNNKKTATGVILTCGFMQRKKVVAIVRSFLLTNKNPKRSQNFNKFYDIEHKHLSRSGIFMNTLEKKYARGINRRDGVTMFFGNRIY